MKSKIFVSFFVLIIFIGESKSQLLPKSFELLNKKNLEKTATSPTPANNSVTDILIVGDTVWIATGQGVSMTTDRGNSWTNFTNDQTFGTEGVSAIGYYNGVFWAATAHDENTSSGSVQTGSGLRYTTDAGKTWTTVAQPRDSASDSVIIYGTNHLRALPVTVPEQNVIFDMAFTPGTIWIATWAGGLRKSTDMGKTWRRVVLPADFLDSVKPSDTLDFCYSPVSGKFCSGNNLNLEGFSVVEANDSTLYVGTAGGIDKSTDGGVSWVKFNHANQTNPISGNFVVALAYNKFDNTIWAATWRAEGATEFYGVSYSTDGGENWQTTLSGEKIHNFAVQNNQVIAVSDDGAFRASGNYKNWILPNTITDSQSGISIFTTAFYSAAFQGSSVWLGSSDGLARIDENKNIMWNGDWKVFFGSKPLSSAADTYAFPNPFDPRTDILKIKYNANGNGVPVTIRIFDFGMHFVRTVIQNAPRGNQLHSVGSGETLDYWDGTDDNGNMVPNGAYFYRIDAGSQKPVYGKILVLH